MADPTTGDLFKAKIVTDDEVNTAVDIFMRAADVRLFRFASGHTLDLAAAVRASRHATATLTEPTAKDGSKRSAVRTAILLARPVAP
ncbi:hypothetical protein FV222_23700 [Methylobacterium sp. WL103]|uniref:hypothetical protein n=1 Tax=Methylobacterium sp. WL103 TaxID=2603891 RepID=UPI0011C834D4|nr:hypothetical protein [Methylobacterium sp. WL103]TXM92099.1 hypothetical protein FV222_23700 [Methylobacterium sp. WL103]